MNAFEKSNCKLSTMVTRTMQMNRSDLSSPRASIALSKVTNREKNLRGVDLNSEVFGLREGDEACERYNDEVAPPRKGVYQETVLDPSENIKSEAGCENLSFEGDGDGSVALQQTTFQQVNLSLSHRAHCIRQETGTRQEKREEYARYLSLPDCTGCCEPKPTGYLQDLSPQQINFINGFGFSPGEDRRSFFRGEYHG